MDEKCCPKDEPLQVHLEHHTAEYEFYQGCEMLATSSGTALVFPLRKRGRRALATGGVEDEAPPSGPAAAGRKSTSRGPRKPSKHTSSSKGRPRRRTARRRR